MLDTVDIIKLLILPFIFCSLIATADMAQRHQVHDVWNGQTRKKYIILSYLYCIVLGPIALGDAIYWHYKHD